MLLFRKEFVLPIIKGHKRQTRRLSKPRLKVGKVYPCRTNLYRGEPFALIKVKNIRTQRLSEITEEEAHAEGARSREEFLLSFRRIYNLKPSEDPLVWVVEFELIEVNPNLKGTLGL